MARDVVRLREVEHDEVSIHTKLELAAFFLAALRARAADRRHHERGLCRDGGRVAGFALGHQRRGLDLLKEVVVVVGCDRVGAEADVHAGLHHAHYIGTAGSKLQIADRAVRGGDVPLGEQAHILLRQPDAVRRDGGYVEKMMAVEQLRGRQPVFFDALVMLALRLGEVHLHAELFIDGKLAQRVPQLIGRCIFRVDGRLNFDAPIVIALPLVAQGDQLLTGGEFFKVKVVAEEHRHAARNIRLDPALGHGLADRVAVIVHVGHRRHTEAQTLRDRQLRRRLDRAVVQMGLAREDIVVQPFLQFEVVRVAAQNRHRQMGVAVDQARHEHHAAAVDDGLRLLLGRFFPEIADLSVRHAEKAVRPDRHAVVHGDDGNMGE